MRESEQDSIPHQHPPGEGLSDRRRETLRRAAPWALSLAMHATLIVLATTIVWSISAPDDGPRIVASFDDPAPSPAQMETASDTPESSAQAPAHRTSPLPERPKAPSLSDLLAALGPAPAEPAAAAPAPDVQDMVKRRRTPDVRFAGLGASNARSVIYVVDASGSTISTFPIILDELRRSALRLAPTQQFQVIFFGPGGYTAARHPADGEGELKTIRLIRATRSNVQAVLEWAAGVQPRQRSNPIPALEIALSLRPDAIFVLSTAITGLGVWEPDKAAILAQLDALNPQEGDEGRRPAVIKTVQLFDDDPAGILRAIGEAHGGKDGYKFLSRREVLAP